MNCVNKVILVGRLGADPELRSTNSGKSVCQMSLATNYSFTDSSGKQQENVNWHRIVTWGKQAEICHTYLRKGRQIYVEGRLQNNTYTDKEGTKRFSTEIVSQYVLFLGDGKGHDQSENTEDKDQLPF